MAVDQQEIHAVQFAGIVQEVGARARALGLMVPSFRSPPAIRCAVRSLRRLDATHVVIAISLVGRSAEAVRRDVVDGVIVANRLSGRLAHEMRVALRSASDDHRRAA